MRDLAKLVFEKVISKTIKTTATKIPSSAQVIIKNPLKNRIFLNSIMLHAKLEFLTRGKVIVKVGGNVVFEPEDDELQFQNTTVMPIPFNDKPFERDDTIEVFAWNGIDSDEVSLTVVVKISEKKGAGSGVGGSGAGAITVTSEDVRRRNSIFEITIPNSVYFNETITSLIDMLGYTKMILLIASRDYVSPELELNEYSFPSSELNARDGDVLTNTGEGQIFSGSGSGDLSVEEKIYSIDFGSISSRIPRAIGTIDADAPSGGDSVTADVFFEISDDNISWTLIDSETQTDAPGAPGTLATPFDFTGVEQSFRYSRLRAKGSRGSFDVTFGWGNAQLQVDEIFDGKLFGGVISISFDVLDPSSLQWLELISASDIGGVSQGQKVVKTIGDLINDVSNDKFNFALPSTATSFRIKAIVAGGGIQTSVSIVKID